MCIESKAVINAIKVAIIGCVKSVLFTFSSKILNNDNPSEANIMGIDRSIEIIAAESLLTLNILAPIIVTPALLAPGINAKT